MRIGLDSLRILPSLISTSNSMPYTTHLTATRRAALSPSPQGRRQNKMKQFSNMQVSGVFKQRPYHLTQRYKSNAHLKAFLHSLLSEQRSQDSTGFHLD